MRFVKIEGERHRLIQVLYFDNVPNEAVTARFVKKSVNGPYWCFEEFDFFKDDLIDCLCHHNHGGGGSVDDGVYGHEFDEPNTMWSVWTEPGVKLLSPMKNVNVLDAPLSRNPFKGTFEAGHCFCCTTCGNSYCDDSMIEREIEKRGKSKFILIFPCNHGYVDENGDEHLFKNAKKQQKQGETTTGRNNNREKHHVRNIAKTGGIAAYPHGKNRSGRHRRPFDKRDNRGHLRRHRKRHE